MIKETKIWFFEKIKNLINTQPDLSRKKRERAQINKIRNEKGDVTMDTTDKQMIMRLHKQLYVKKMGHQEEVDKCLERYNLPTPNQEEIENINRQITSTEKAKQTNKQKNYD